MKRSFGLLFLIAIAFFSITHSALAFTIHPAIFELAADPGSRISGMITVLNDEADAQTFYLSAQKFVPMRERGEQQYLPIEDQSGLPSWIHFAQKVLTLKPNEQRDVFFDINIPTKATVGGHYATIFFSTQPLDQKVGGSVASRTGSLLLLTVKGETRTSGRVTSFTSSQSSAGVSFQTQLQNDGNVHLTPKGRIVITNIFGQTIASLSINPDGSRILPDSVRAYLSMWSAEKSLFTFAIGPCKARLVMEAPFSSDAIPAISFWLWPWRTCLVISGAFIFLILGCWASFRRPAV